MAKKLKKPKRRIPLPKKTETVHADKAIYNRRAKHKKLKDNEL